ncbi:MAG: peptidoglycan DD-metalloendopeptidase family protein [Clostridia bacterium]|nr:peptidoglycan DD-metalloendopeptidase family protein [Clostridia bacterium]MBR4261227.1 peptidoglycan DD-metalloendopeptidase family protein [Clostridia bacterium]
MKNIQKITSSVIIMMIICSLSFRVFAIESSSYYQNKQNEALQNSQATQSQLNDVEGEIDEVLQEVANLNSSILEYETQIQQLNERLEELQTSINEKQKELEEKKEMLENRLVAMYMEKQPTFLDVVLSGNLMNFITNQDMIKQIADYDNKLITEVEELKTSLENQKNEVESVKLEVEQKSKELQALKAEKEEKVANLTEEQKELESKLSQYKAQAEQYAELERQAIAKEEAARKAAAQQASRSNSGNTTNNNTSNVVTNPYSGGKLNWPCPSSSRITSPYGWRYLFGVRDFHTGVDIGAVHGSNICAAESGTVILANYGWNGGYGNYIIINHGNGITTRYAHASQLYVSAGQTVSRGQVIAAVGTTGNSTGPHLHFEVRVNGSHTNPLNYL